MLAVLRDCGLVETIGRLPLPLLAPPLVLNRTYPSGLLLIHLGLGPPVLRSDVGSAEDERVLARVVTTAATSSTKSVRWGCQLRLVRFLDHFLERLTPRRVLLPWSTSSEAAAGDFFHHN